MRAFGIILAVAATVASSPALAQATPNVVAPAQGLQTPLTFTTTTCMMNCNFRHSATIEPEVGGSIVRGTGS